MRIAGALSSRPIVSMAIVIGALAALVAVVVELPPRIDRKLHTAIGAALAKEALSLLGQNGRITVISRDTESFPQPAIDALMEGFERQVRAGGGVIAATQRIQSDPLRPVEVPPTSSSGMNTCCSLAGETPKTGTPTMSEARHSEKYARLIRELNIRLE